MGLSEKVNVLRREPRDRSRFKGLCGIIHTTLLADSYIHIGSSTIPLTVNEEILTNLVKSGRKDIASLLRAAKFMEVIQFNISGNRPTIPGSSVKGNIRSRLELSFRPKNGYVRSCFIRAGRPPIKEPERGTHGWRHHKIWGSVLFEERGLPCDLTRMNNICLICDLFGTAGLKSLIDFSDFIGEGNIEDILEELSLEYGMNLVAAKPGSKFNGKII
ncbi:MAG: RAMP superfamily CRISPR-associated protein, partial [Candidatus Bathyarchaeota archaeon]|nr:RAMP superfamily CRISPR-associated protein [Candidatus Bathyarchaeota archaeon]